MGRIESDLVNGQVYHRELNTNDARSESIRGTTGKMLSNESDCRPLMRGQLISHSAHVLNQLTITDVPPPPLANRGDNSGQIIIPALEPVPGSPPLHRGHMTYDAPVRGPGFDTAPAPHIFRDDNQRIERIDYPAERKTREFGRDANGQIDRLTTTTPEGKFNYVKEGDKWYLLGADNNRYPAPSVTLNERGEFSKKKNDSTWITQRLDGSSFEETIIASGARLRFDEQGRYTSIVSPGGQKERVFEYKGDTKELSAVSIYDHATNEVKKFRKEGDGQWVHLNKQGQADSTWKGEIKIRDDGTYCIKEAGKTDDKWLAFHTDGKVQQEKIPTIGKVDENVVQTSFENRLEPPRVSQSAQEARKALEELAHSRGINTERLKTFMDTFESRCANGRKDGLQAPNDQQVARTYENITAMLNGKSGGGSYFNEKQRNRLCEEALYNISHPTRINQGSNPTCNMTTGEIFIAARQPDKYAEVLKQVALDGRLKTSSGKSVDVHPSALTPTQEEGVFDPDVDYKSNCRNWASHVMQIFGVNAFTKFAQPNPYLPAWGREYRGGADNPCMGGDAIKQAVKELTGADMPYVEHLVAPSEDQLWRLKKDGNFPVGVPTLYSWGRYGLSEEHVQTIHDVRKVNGTTQVYLDDQHGSWDDRGWITLAQLYERQRLQVR